MTVLEPALPHPVPSYAASSYAALSYPASPSVAPPRWGWRALGRLLAIVLGLWLLAGWAFPSWALTVEEVPNPRAESEWVSDVAEVISAPTERRLNGLMAFLEGETSVEMAIATIPDTPAGMTPKAFATELFNTWGVGKAATNNGILLLLSMGDRRIEIELGRGMEERWSGDRLARLMQDTIRPALQAGDVDTAVWAGAGAIVADLTGVDPNAPVAFPWARMFYTALLLLGIGCLAGGFFGVTRLYQQPVPLPPTGRQPFRYQYGQPKLKDAEFAFLVKKTPHRPQRPAALLSLLACGFPLTAAALAFWLATLWAVPYDTRTDLFLLLTAIAGVPLGLLLPLYLEPYLHPSPGSKPFNFLQSFGLASSSSENGESNGWLQWAIALGMFSYVVCMIGGALFVALFLYSSLWYAITVVTPTLMTSVMLPLFVGLGNGAIVAYYLRNTLFLNRPASSYCCAACEGELVDLGSTSPELRELLPARPNTTYRAWYCPACHPTLNEEGIFLFTEEITPPVSSKTTAPYKGKTKTSRRSSSTYDSDDIAWNVASPGSDSDFGGGTSDGGGTGDNW